MRIIKFRGRHIEDGNWVYGYLVFSQSGICSIRSTDDFLTYQVDPDTVGEFTGLYDSGGIEIYENDIIQFGDDASCRFRIVFKDGGFGIAISSIHFIRIDDLKDQSGETENILGFVIHK